ncbi:MAG: nucleotidyltransferase domain-containing protein [Polyangiales bacterium]
MPGDREQILERVGAALERRGDVLEGYVFGSVARDDAQPHSDVDVAVFLDPSKPATSGSFGVDAEIATDLIEALGRNDVDVVLLAKASPLLYHRVLRDGVRVFSRDLVATTTREGRALSRWFDWAKQLEKIDRAFGDRVARGDVGK